MGLLQKLSDSGFNNSNEVKTAAPDKPVEQKKSNSVGLLKKSLMASDSRKLDFFEFAGKYDLEICAFLTNKDGSYKIQNCIGFDGESIYLSVSTADFWDGTITNTNHIYSFNTASSQLPFFQFFSKKLKDKIETIQIIKTRNNSIFFICNTNLNSDSEFISDLEAVEKTPLQIKTVTTTQTDDFSKIYTLDFSEALESFILSSKNDIQFLEVIVNELFFNLCKNFPDPNKIDYSSKGTFTLYLAQDIPVELLYNHLRFECNFILGNHSELLSVTECQNSTEVAR